ncbi:hypothetical protein NHX12_023666 [Muraenolepis orangiensis]|uniref:Claspin n=1 Tax=Muraenolepis orangiensis TaxID=630683 RepID=A0A9Q0EJZ5_9TELE|nr:hypothetical protein NHX12_023666 [Muraenolepis orangiensis]
MSLVLSQQAEVVLPLVPGECDSDSGMGSPEEEMVVTETTSKAEHCPDLDSDDGDEILVHRKPRCHKAIRDKSEEEAEVEESKKKKKGRRISRAPIDSDDESDLREGGAEKKKEEEAEEEEVKMDDKSKDGKREKSKRHKEKREKRSKAVDKVKATKKNKKERLNEVEQDAPVPGPLNDSGCLLGDTDLYDTGLDGDSAEEESLDAIRAAVKQKAREHKKPQRVERKAARASKEAMKQLHSESQRLVRESSLGLPYHIPKPKTINDFFKRRARPEGPAMALLKSSTYQKMILEATPAPPPPSTSEPQQPASDRDSSTPALDLGCSHLRTLPHPATASSPQQESLSQGTGALPSTLPPDQDSGPMLYLSESLQGSLATDDSQELKALPSGPQGGEDGHPGAQPRPRRSSDSPASQAQGAEALAGDDLVVQAPPAPRMEVCVDGVAAAAAVVAGSQGPAVKPKKDRLARLRELGLVPPPVPKLCADEGAFIHLEPPQLNPGVEALKERYLRHMQPVARPQGESNVQLNIVRKATTPSGQEELQTESITVTIKQGGPEEAAGAIPGERLSSLKQRLQHAMALRRQEERARKGVDDLVAPSVRSPSPVALKPTSSISDLLNGDGSLMLFAGNSCSRMDGVRKSAPPGPYGYSKMEDEDSLSLAAKQNSCNSSFELLGSMIPSYQPVSNQRSTGRGGANYALFRSPSPCFFRPSFLGSASKSSGKMSEPSLSLPVEDSQDLYAPSSPGGDSGPLGTAQGRFSLEDDANSQLLDADGYLNVGPRTGGPGPHKRQLILGSLDENAMDANMGELLGMCSGAFSGGGGGTGASSGASTRDSRARVKTRLAQYVDSEAELSGSDELQEQVNKIHMKQLMDDDKRRLRLYQERFLADGDLHSDGPGRARRFRWKNMGTAPPPPPPGVISRVFFYTKPLG